MPERVHAGVLRFAILGDDIGCDHRRLEAAGNDVGEVLDVAGAIRKH
ncbi:MULTISPECIES: hypothetical protein [Bradyrhizobium]|jgi:hypothetical protein|nr:MULTISPECIES: hypothetical protein [Bradyrhizobium]MCP1742378.1 hypothetical protein [Bradyrhizobium japonicum]MBR0944447.1 hypothetical protein [Bradyrhizobium liaoningense]MCP1780742.1 hypothetical protein [Bradyrhizobium japonicum]MCP1860089.1 hypothetical protein [Bradyrhizobium japonicum]MCP1956265.1 hypothetical protein [Bradyrhizobium japonicum]